MAGTLLGMQRERVRCSPQHIPGTPCNEDGTEPLSGPKTWAIFGPIASGAARVCGPKQTVKMPFAQATRVRDPK